MQKTTKGCLWIVLPLLALPLILGAWAFLSFVFTSALAAGEPSANAPLIMRIFNIVLGLLGLTSFIMVPVGLVVGIVILTKKEPASPELPSQQPPMEPPTPPSDTNMQTPA